MQSETALHTDKYQITMIYAHWKNGTHRNRCAFDLYFRSLPFGNGFAVFAGLERCIRYLEHLRFTEEDLAYLASDPEGFEPEFLEMLRTFRFTGNVYAMPEGSMVFANEPLMRVEGSIMELQLMETALLNFIGYQTLVATKAARIRLVAPDDKLMEFGTRRAQEAEAALWGARAAYIGGFDATSNVRAGKHFGIPTNGTHSHSWVQEFPRELEAFRAFVRAFPDQAVLLVDTYDTLKSGLPHAIQVGKELQAQGKTLAGIRLDSGDLAFLSKQARQMLDEAGLMETRIVASSDLDENTIHSLKAQGAKIDAWGVGTRLITAYDQPSLGCVYKMVAREEGGKWIPTLKISSNPEKVTTPDRKKVFRIIDRKENKARGDLITHIDETINEHSSLILFHPVHTHRRKKVTHFRAVPLHVPIFQEGKRVYDLPSLDQIRSFRKKEMALFWEEYLRLLNPEEYPVDLSTRLWKTKQDLMESIYTLIREENGC